MELSELTAYAEEKHHIGVELRRQPAAGVTVLLHPVSGKQMAVLLRQWDEALGEEVQFCDLKCGHGELLRGSEPYLTAPFRMQGPDWVGVRFGEGTERETVFRLFDMAVRLGRSPGYTVTLGSLLPARGSDYRDTPLPPPGDRPRREKPKPPEKTDPLEKAVRQALDAAARAARAWGIDISSGGEAAAETGYRDTPLPPRERSGLPQKLREMLRLYSPGIRSFRDTCRNFYTQGKFTEDYEDDAPWNGELHLYYPTYHDLRPEQLRGYFTWRTALRRGEYRPVSLSLAYIYVYELLNDIGTAGPADSLRKLKEFEAGFVDAGLGDGSMRTNLRRWMLEKAVVGGLPPEQAREYADPELMRRDEALAVLRKPDAHTDEEVFEALALLGGSKLAASPAAQDAEGRSLFARVWRKAAAEHRANGKNLFALCFGSRRSRRWYPLANAVYYERERPAGETCELNESRKYAFNGAVWTEQCYRKERFDKRLLSGLLHEAERQLRAWRKLGRALLERPEEAWAKPYAEAVVQEDRQARAAAARKKITVDLGSLEQIRRDALLTRDSLLTEEDLLEAEAPEAVPVPAAEETAEAAPSSAPDLPLDEVQTELLTLLLRGEPVKGFLAEKHRMPTVEADAINEALYDEIGDSVLECDGDGITLAEDYREDVLRLLGG